MENPYGDDSDCNPWNDDCPGGQKCANYGTSPRCVELVANPSSLDGPCSVDADAQLDDCDRGLACWHGTCLGVCQCSTDFMHCEDPAASCHGAGYGPDFCRRTCDPLTPSCPVGTACSGNFAGYFCFDNPNDPTPETRFCGEQECPVGSDCLEATGFSGLHPSYRVPGCAEDVAYHGCCAELCSKSNGGCSDPRTTCEPMTTWPGSFDCTGDAGVCLLPE